MDYDAGIRPDRSVAAATVDVATADGRMLTSIFAPDDARPVPAIILLMDAIGIRDELRNMAGRLAGAGYVVALPNLYYRLGVLDTGPLPAAENMSARTRISDMVESLTMPAVMDAGTICESCRQPSVITNPGVVREPRRRPAKPAC
jgi:hypothetical protein